MSNISVVTSFSPEGYEKYGKRCLETFDQYWPKGCQLVAYVDERPREEYSARIRYENLEAVNPILKRFKDRHLTNNIAHGKKEDGSYTFLYDAVRFSHKVFAYTHAIMNAPSWIDRVIWLDADCVTHAPTSNAELYSLLADNELCGFFERVNNYPETGFIIFNTAHKEKERYARWIQQVYDKDMIFTLPRWTDCHVYEYIVKQARQHGMVCKNLSGEHSTVSHPIIHVLGHFLDHLKGERKIIGKSDIKKKDLRIARTEPYWTK